MFIQSDVTHWVIYLTCSSRSVYSHTGTGYTRFPECKKEWLLWGMKSHLFALHWVNEYIWAKEESLRYVYLLLFCLRIAQIFLL